MYKRVFLTLLSHLPEFKLLSYAVTSPHVRLLHPKFFLGCIDEGGEKRPSDSVAKCFILPTHLMTTTTYCPYSVLEIGRVVDVSLGSLVVGPFMSIRKRRARVSEL